MSELGRLLAEARNARSLSLADAESATRVRQKYLEALELGNYAALPPSAIARGFLRNYSRYLGLNSTETLRLYAQESGDRTLEPGQNGPVRPMRPIDYRPLEVTLLNEDRRPGSAWWRWLIAVLLLAAVGVGAWWLSNNGDWVRRNISLRPNLLAALGPQPTATRTPTTRPAPSQVVATITPPVAPAAAAQGQQAASSDPTSAALMPSPTSDLLTLPIPTTQPTVTPTPTPSPTPLPEPAAGISLTLKITQRSWTKVTADGNMVMQELLEAGQERGWAANERITILTGNAAGVIVTINGQSLGAMGNVGQVIERTWGLDKDGNIAEVALGQATPAPAPEPTRTP